MNEFEVMKILDHPNVLKAVDIIYDDQLYMKNVQRIDGTFLFKIKSFQKFNLKMIKIPIENYEKDIDANFSKEEKSEILDLFTKSIKLSSESEFFEIENCLQEAILQGDIDLIKIYLIETIQSDSEDLKFKIDRTTRTASLFGVHSNISQLYISRAVQHESTEYLITSITGTNRSIETVIYLQKIW